MDEKHQHVKSRAYTHPEATGLTQARNRVSPSIRCFSSQMATGRNGVYLTEGELRRREDENLSVVRHKTNWKIEGANGAAELPYGLVLWHREDGAEVPNDAGAEVRKSSKPTTP